MIIGRVVSLHSASVYAWLASTSDVLLQVIMSSCTDMTDDRNYKPWVKIPQVSVSLQWQRYALQWMPSSYSFNIYKLNVAVISQKRTVKMCQRGSALWVVRVRLLTPTLLAPVFITSYRTETQDVVDSCHIFSSFTVKFCCHKQGWYFFSCFAFPSLNFSVCIWKNKCWSVRMACVHLYLSAFWCQDTTLCALVAKRVEERLLNHWPPYASI